MADAILASSGIYQIRNTTNGKLYVGSAINLRTRFNQHRSDLNTGRHCNAKLLSSWRKYGAGAFVFEVIETVLAHGDLIAREQFWIDRLSAANGKFGYNILPTAGSCLGHIKSQETREKSSKALKGRKRAPEVMARIAEANRGKKRDKQVGEKIAALLKGYKHTTQARANMKAGRDLVGRAHSEATKEKISEFRKGMPLSDAHRANIGLVQRGVKKSPESVERRASSMRGRTLSEAHIAKLRGRSLSDEHRAKLSLANTGKKMSDEARKNMSIAAKNRRKVKDELDC